MSVETQPGLFQEAGGPVFAPPDPLRDFIAVGRVAGPRHQSMGEGSVGPQTHTHTVVDACDLLAQAGDRSGLGRVGAGQPAGQDVADALGLIGRVALHLRRGLGRLHRTVKSGVLQARRLAFHAPDLLGQFGDRAFQIANPMAGGFGKIARHLLPGGVQAFPKPE